jgi:predicted transcriptional regulator
LRRYGGTAIVNLDNAEYEALQRITTDAERSLAWLGRRAIRDFTKQRERADVFLLPGLMAEETSGRQSAT